MTPQTSSWRQRQDSGTEGEVSVQTSSLNLEFDVPGLDVDVPRAEVDVPGPEVDVPDEKP